MSEEIKLFVSTPCYGGQCLDKYFTSMVRLQILLMKKGIQMYLDTTENESLVQRARQVALARFYQKTDATHFLFIDADIEFDPQSVISLLEGGHEVSCAVYPKKVIMWDQLDKAVKEDDTRSPIMLSSSLVINFGASSRPVDNGFVEVLDAATGFLLIKRDVVTKMHDAYPELYCVNDHQNADFKNYYALFDCMIDPVSKRYLSEDYSFSRRWQQIGGKVYAHVHTTLGHVGNLPFVAKMDDRLKSETVA